MSLWRRSTTQHEPRFSNVRDCRYRLTTAPQKFGGCWKHLRSSNRLKVPTSDVCIGPLASFLLFNLIEDKTACQVDHANGGRTQLMNFERRDWDDDLLAGLNVPKSILPLSRGQPILNLEN